MKYIVIPYIALGIVLSLLVGIEYNCIGEELLPDYYGSPFVFKQKSLVTSMAYYYSISGLILNILVWSGLLFLLRFVVIRMPLKTRSNKILIFIHKVGVGVLIIFTTLNIVIETAFVSSGFEENQNYWYFDIDEEAEKWGMECEGKLMFFRS